MTARKVRFTATARDQLLQLRRWWDENTPRPEILSEDLDEALRVLAEVPAIGSPYSLPLIPGLRRFYLQRLTTHLYFTFDEDEVVVRALWHARRGQGPDFGRGR